MSILKSLTSIEDTPGMPEAIANVAARSAGSVCAVCGLGQMGHTPESQWLGYERHDWNATPATPAMLKRANELTSAAYRASPTNTQP